MINPLIAEDEKETISEHVIRLKELFKSFTITHEQYHDTLKDDTDIDESEQYFCKVQQSYIEILKDAKEGSEKMPMSKMKMIKVHQVKIYPGRN